jgi:hypothetical protein
MEEGKVSSCCFSFRQVLYVDGNARCIPGASCRLCCVLYIRLGGTQGLRVCSALQRQEGGQWSWVQSKLYSLGLHSMVERWFGMGNDEGQGLIMGYNGGRVRR